MATKCPQCGEVYEQAVNFCRKCGNALTSEQLKDTAIISPSQDMATQEMTSVMTRHLNADAGTSPIKRTGSAPANQTTPAAAASTQKPMPDDSTEAGTAILMDSASSVPASPASDQNAAKTSAPKESPLPPTVPPQATTPSAPVKSGNRVGLVALGVLVLGAIIGGAVYFMRQPPAQTATDTSIASTPAVAEPQPAASVPPDVIGDVTTNNNIATPGTTPLMSKGATPRPTGSPLANKEATTAPTKPVETATTTPTAAPTVAPAPAKVEAAPAESGASYIAQGNRYLSAKQFPEAIAAYQKARNVEPGNADIHYLMGSAYHQMGKLSEALAQYRQCKSGSYAAVAANHVKNLEKKLGKNQY